MRTTKVSDLPDLTLLFEKVDQAQVGTQLAVSLRLDNDHTQMLDLDPPFPQTGGNAVLESLRERSKLGHINPNCSVQRVKKLGHSSV